MNDPRKTAPKESEEKVIEELKNIYDPEITVGKYPTKRNPD
jgi:metal-sulfur cluster biosynthetic enzyme